MAPASGCPPRASTPGRSGWVGNRRAGRCALSQIGNVGPDLGQGYIVDSFMWSSSRRGPARGTVYAALVLGFANKLLESWSGAVIAKIAVLVFIISSSSAGRRVCSR